MRNIGVGILSTIAMLAWWTFTGDGDGGASFEAALLPAVVAGGGRSIEIALHTSEPVYFSATFACGDVEDDTEIGGREELAPGDHHLVFDVSGDCGYGILEAGADEPPVGAELGWKVTVDGKAWDEESMTLDQPLEPNYAFFLQTGWDDGSLNEYLAYRAAN